MRFWILFAALTLSAQPSGALNDFLAGRWKELYARGSSGLRSKVTAEMFITQMGPQISAALGTCKPPASPPAHSVEQGMNRYVYRVECEKQTVGLGIATKAAGEMEGIFLLPPPSLEPAPTGGLEVVSGKYRLPAKLTLPQGPGPFPAVVLVHGSGPHDMDETIGPNKVFLDIAEGLAARGVGSLRYEKRTKRYGASLPPDITLHEETVEDALHALALLRKQPRVDPKRTYVAGHSLGAYAAPRIAKADPPMRGLILLAGNTRPIDILIDEQMKYLGAGPEQAAKIKAMIPDAYRKDLADYDPVAAAAALSQPLLILQGDRDYQVTLTDFAGWQKLPANRATLRRFPKLNHLFMEGEGKSTPAEYDRPGKVSAEVLDAVAGWIREH
jgi:fermentation-respiration switch protein FrsA (DUF1100 family)